MVSVFENGNGEVTSEHKFGLKPSLTSSALDFGRHFSFDGKSVYEFDIYGNPINWIREEVRVTDDMGKTIFTQPNVARPDFWSSLAIKVVASKYFWGNLEKGEREDGADKLIGRVSRYFGRQALKQGYFDEKNAEILKDEVAAICLNQLAAFNSPVWFNCGIQEYTKEAGGVAAYKWDSATNSIIHTNKTDDRPQCSACFIQSVEDNMDSIMALQVSEANLFKAGSGTGTNRSSLRSSKERLTGGGRASGPVSFMKGYDAYAGVIKSGGKTRRAAKMEILNIDHPDIMEFINAKQNEEKKAWALIEQGYAGGMNGEAYSSVAFQNCNLSVRASDSFMEAAKKDADWNTKAVKDGSVIGTFKAKEMLKKIAEGTWICGDPGMQFDTIINRYHTCKNSGRINASNPCFVGSTKVALADGRDVTFKELVEEHKKGKQNYCYTIRADGHIGIQMVINPRVTRKDAKVIKIILDNNEEIVCTPDHLFMLKSGQYKPAKDLLINESLMPLYEKEVSIKPKNNHKVKRMEEVSEIYDVYDLEVPETHNFALSAGVFVHNCSEYMFLDDSACNLASINLIKLQENGKFDVEKYKKIIKYFIVAQELAVDGSSYPTEKIAKNSHDFRPLGLGYANLGALLMSLGLPYDSDSGRAVAAAITAIMGGESYKISAQLASLVGPFPRYKENKEPMMDVMRLHRENVKKINVEKIPEHLRYLVNDAWDCWSEAIELGEKYGYRNSQVTVLAPTGTIAFLMDCDTTGIEPDIALVKYKVLSGGGMLKIVNRAVPLALRTLGYNEIQTREIVEYVDKNDMIEGAPHLKEEHLPVFDCAFKPAKGKRSIGYKGHIDMMAETQPFLSGAISKTVNMPEQSKIEDIADAYMHSWEKGLKAVAIYRENSKRSQPLNTKKTEGEVVKKEIKEEPKLIVIEKAGRRKMPQTRRSMTHKFEIAGHEGYITVGLYDDGKPGEVFVTMHKEGSTIRGLMDAWATSVSLNLQYGATVTDLFGKFRYQKFEPSGFVKNVGGGDLDEKLKPIRTASSIVDYVAQFMMNHFGESAAKIEVEIKSLEVEEEKQLSIKDFGKEEDRDEREAAGKSHEGLTCPHCGGPAKRLGSCAIFCTSCKQTTRQGCGE